MEFRLQTSVINYLLFSSDGTGTTIKGTPFGEYHPLWVCKKALNTEYKCTYARCNNCGTINKSRRTRKKAILQSQHGEDDNHCSYHVDNTECNDLQVFTDIKQLHFTYTEARNNRNDQSNLPTICKGCKKDILLNGEPLSSYFYNSH